MAPLQERFSSISSSRLVLLALTRERLADFEPKELAPTVRDVHVGIQGKRKSKKDKLREAGSASVE